MKLYVHIGAGKTGSTSIQHLCEAERTQLDAQGIAYLGNTLEYAATRSPFEWQIRLGSQELLHQMDAQVAETEIYTVLAEELARLSQRGYKCAIWSNESLFVRNKSVIPALQRLVRDGAEIEVVLYLRRHDAWARSAYAQWGITHKSYSGPVIGFSDWISQRPPRFADDLATWHQTLGPQLKPLNYDLIDDTVSDFLSIVGASVPSTRRALPSPGTTELAAWAVYNSRFEGHVLPTAFRSILRSLDISPKELPAIDPPKNLLPSETALDEVRTSAAKDLERINEILAQHDEKGLSFDTALSPREAPDTWDLIRYLMVMNFSLQHQVDALTKRLDDLGG